MDMGLELSLKCHSGLETWFGEFSQACFFLLQAQAFSCNKQSGAAAKMPGPDQANLPSVPYPTPQQQHFAKTLHLGNQEGITYFVSGIWFDLESNLSS